MKQKKRLRKTRVIWSVFKRQLRRDLRKVTGVVSNNTRLFTRIILTLVALSVVVAVISFVLKIVKFFLSVDYGMMKPTTTNIPYQTELIFLMPLVALVFLFWAFRRRSAEVETTRTATTASDPTANTESRYTRFRKHTSTTWHSRWFKIITGIILFNLCIMWMPDFGPFYRKAWHTNLIGMLLSNACIIFGLRMLPETKKEIQHTIGIVVTVTGIVSYIFCLGGTVLLDKGLVWWNSPSTSVTTTSLTTITPTYDFPINLRNNETAKKTYDFWMDNLQPKSAAYEMFLVCGQESQYSQFENDGITPLHGKVNPHDIGVCQVNEDLWGKKADELGEDLGTLDGNLKTALWIRKNHGPEKWNTLAQVRARNPEGQPSELYFAPTDKEQWVRVKVTAGMKFDSSADILVRADNMTPFLFHPHDQPNFVSSEVGFQSSNSKPDAIPATVYVYRR